MNLKGRSFLKLLDFTPAEITYLLGLAAELKAKKKAGIPHRIHEGKNIALLFEKDSTRTRCAFEVAGHDLGMGVHLSRPHRLPDGQERIHRRHRPGAGPDVRRHRIPGLRPDHRGAAGQVLRRAGLERPDQRIPPHPDTCGFPHHSGAFRRFAGEEARVHGRRPVQHGRFPDGGLRQDGDALRGLRPGEVFPRSRADRTVSGRCRRNRRGAGIYRATQTKPSTKARM